MKSRSVFLFWNAMRHPRLCSWYIFGGYVLVHEATISASIHATSWSDPYRRDQSTDDPVPSFVGVEEVDTPGQARASPLYNPGPPKPERPLENVASMHAHHDGRLGTVPKGPKGGPGPSGPLKEIAHLKASAFKAVKKATRALRQAKTQVEKDEANKALEGAMDLVKRRLHLESLAKAGRHKKGAKAGHHKNGAKAGNPKKGAKAGNPKKGAKAKAGNPKKGAKAGNPKNGAKEDLEQRLKESPFGGKQTKGAKGPSPLNKLEAIHAGKAKGPSPLNKLEAIHAGKAKAKKSTGLPSAGAIGNAMKKDLHSMKTDKREEKADRAKVAQDKSRMKKYARMAKALRRRARKKMKRAKALKKRALKRLKHAKTPTEKEAAKAELRKAKKMMQKAKFLEKQHARYAKQAKAEHGELEKEKRLEKGHKSDRKAARKALKTAEKTSKHLEKEEKHGEMAASKGLKNAKKKLNKAMAAEIKFRAGWKAAKKKGHSLIKKAKRLARKAEKLSREAQGKLAKAKTASERKHAEDMLRKAEKIASTAAGLKTKGVSVLEKADELKQKYLHQKQLVKKTKREMAAFKRKVKQMKKLLKKVKKVRAMEKGGAKPGGVSRGIGKGKGTGKGTGSHLGGKSLQFGNSNCNLGSLKLRRAMRAGKKTEKEAQLSEKMAKKLTATEAKNSNEMDAAVAEVQRGTNLLAKSDGTTEKTKATKMLEHAHKKLLKAKASAQLQRRMREKIESTVEDVVETAKKMIQRMQAASRVMLGEARGHPRLLKLARRFKKKVDQNKAGLAKRCAVTRSIERRSRAAQAAIQEFRALATRGNNLKKKILTAKQSGVAHSGNTATMVDTSSAALASARDEGKADIRRARRLQARANHAISLASEELADATTREAQEKAHQKISDAEAMLQRSNRLKVKGEKLLNRARSIEAEKARKKAKRQRNVRPLLREMNESIAGYKVELKGLDEMERKAMDAFAQDGVSSDESMNKVITAASLAKAQLDRLHRRAFRIAESERQDHEADLASEAEHFTEEARELLDHASRVEQKAKRTSDPDASLKEAKRIVTGVLNATRTTGEAVKSAQHQAKKFDKVLNKNDGRSAKIKQKERKQAKNVFKLKTEATADMMKAVQKMKTAQTPGEQAKAAKALSVAASKTRKAKADSKVLKKMKSKLKKAQAKEIAADVKHEQKEARKLKRKARQLKRKAKRVLKMWSVGTSKLPAAEKAKLARQAMQRALAIKAESEKLTTRAKRLDKKAKVGLEKVVEKRSMHTGASKVAQLKADAKALKKKVAQMERVTKLNKDPQANEKLEKLQRQAARAKRTHKLEASLQIVKKALAGAAKTGKGAKLKVKKAKKDPPKSKPKDPPKSKPKNPPKSKPKDPPKSKSKPTDPPKSKPKDPPKSKPKDPPKSKPKAGTALDDKADMELKHAEADVADISPKEDDSENSKESTDEEDPSVQLSQSSDDSSPKKAIVARKQAKDASHLGLDDYGAGSSANPLSVQTEKVPPKKHSIREALDLLASSGSDEKKAGTVLDDKADKDFKQSAVDASNIGRKEDGSEDSEESTDEQDSGVQLSQDSGGSLAKKAIIARMQAKADNLAKRSKDALAEAGKKPGTQASIAKMAKAMKLAKKSRTINKQLSAMKSGS